MEVLTVVFGLTAIISLVLLFKKKKKNSEVKTEVVEEIKEDNHLEVLKNNSEKLLETMKYVRIQSYYSSETDRINALVTALNEFEKPMISNPDSIPELIARKGAKFKNIAFELLGYLEKYARLLSELDYNESISKNINKNKSLAETEEFARLRNPFMMKNDVFHNRAKKLHQELEKELSKYL